MSRDLPGPGDESTWGPVTFPSDPRGDGSELSFSESYRLRLARRNARLEEVAEDLAEERAREY